MDGVKFAVEDIVTFTRDGAQLVGVVESIDGETYSVRIYATSGDNIVPTDETVSLPLSELQPFFAGEEAEDEEEIEIEITTEKALEMLAEEEERQEGEALKELFIEDEEVKPKEAEPNDMTESEDIALGSFVEYDSAAGKVRGKVGDILIEGEVTPEGMEPIKASADKPVYAVEVYEGDEAGGYSPSGIMTYMMAEDLKLCDEPKIGEAKHLPRFAGKMKKAEVSEDVEGQIGYVKGYLSVFDNVDLGGDVVKRGAFKRTLDHKAGKVVMMADHGYRTDEVLGVMELAEDEKGLAMVGKINLKSDQGRNAFETIKFQAEQGVPIGSSIGYEPKQYVPNKTGGYDLTEVELWEGSITPFPMNTEALVTDAYKRYNRNARAKRARLYQTIKI